MSESQTTLERECAREGLDVGAVRRVLEHLDRCSHHSEAFPDLADEHEADIEEAHRQATEKGEEDAIAAGREKWNMAALAAESQLKPYMISRGGKRHYTSESPMERLKGALMLLLPEDYAYADEIETLANECLTEALV